MNTTEPLLLRVSDAAKLLSIGRSHAYELIRQGVIPAIRLGGNQRVPYEALQAMIRNSLQIKEGMNAKN